MTTTRAMAGVSLGPHRCFNLGAACGDAPERVARNRSLIEGALELPASPHWLEQVHGCDVHDADAHADVAPARAPPRADAAHTGVTGRVLAVLTADCLPIALVTDDASHIALVHAGWRGLCAGVLEACIARLPVDPGRLRAWVGPAISAARYEVGEEVREAFVRADPLSNAAFAVTRPGHWSCDLVELARRRLARAGIERVSGGDHCTYTDAERFYSYRRDGVTGRIATLAWLEDRPAFA